MATTITIINITDLFLSFDVAMATIFLLVLLFI